VRVINIFTAAKPWQDVVATIYALDGFLDESIILARDGLAVPGDLKKTRFLIPKRRLRGLSYWWWAAQQVRRILERSKGPSDWIVIEHLVPMTLPILRFIFLLRCPCAIYLQFPAFKFARERGWRADRFAHPLKLTQEISHIFDFLIKRPFMEWLGVLATDVVMANSQEILDTTTSAARSRKRVIVPNSVNRSNRPLHQREHGAGLKLLFVAAMQPHKGIATALEVFFRVFKQFPDAQLVCVGDVLRRDRAWFQALLEKYQSLCRGAISYLGRVPFGKLPEIYAGADVFFFPSYYEGSPRVVCEALSYGCVAVVSDLSGTRQLDPQGKVLQFFKPGDLDSAVEILLGFAQNAGRLAELRASSEGLMEMQFRPESIGSVVLSVYRELRRLNAGAPSAQKAREQHVE
jgi:glycosyltransferase involved in cell wall biosynthesis